MGDPPPAPQQPPPPPGAGHPPPPPGAGYPPPPTHPPGAFPGAPAGAWTYGPSGLARPRWRWVAFGCGGCLLFAVVLLVVGGVVIWRAVGASPLAGFPVYAGSHLVTLNVGASTSGNVDHRVWDEPASVTTVEDFYARALRGAWVVDSRDDATATWAFHRQGRARESGTIVFLGRGTATEVDVTYDY